MKKNHIITGYTIGLILAGILNLNGQNVSVSKVEFMNAPVLFKEDNRLLQQVIASYQSEEPGKIVFEAQGRELLNTELKKENNRFLLTFPAVTKPHRINRSIIRPPRNTNSRLFLLKNGRSILFSIHIPTLDIHVRNLIFLPNKCAILIMHWITATRPTSIPIRQNCAGPVNLHGSQENTCVQDLHPRLSDLRNGSAKAG
jgi:hypothetical protein